MTSLALNEHFFSPQGEGSYTGTPTVFIRFFGCNLDCSWCDQPNALRTRPGQTYRDSSDEEISDLVCAYPVSVPVCFTGGEPTNQHEALVACIEAIKETDIIRAAENKDKIHSAQRIITIETNGTLYIPNLPTGCFLSISPKFTGVFLDQKLTAYGQKEILQWVGDSKHRKQLKFVVESPTQFKGILGWLEKIPKTLRSTVDVYFQPEWYSKEKNQLRESFREYSAPEEWSKISLLGYKSVRFTTQSHKYLAMR